MMTKDGKTTDRVEPFAVGEQPQRLVMNAEVEVESCICIVTMHNQASNDDDPGENGGPNERGGK